MYTSFTLNSEIARQRRSVLIARSARYRKSHRSIAAVPETSGSVVALPAARVVSTCDESLVA